jgi:lipopolysaccharide transport system permease protein
LVTTWSALARRAELVVHLALRQVSSNHRFTLLGWMWPLARQLAQLAVLVFIFSTVFDLGIDDYGVFVFTGIVAYTWFSSGASAAARSLVDQRHLVFQPRFPTAVLPVVALAVPLVDVLLALPVLLAMLGVSGDLHPAALLLPPLLGVQLVLMCGIAWLAAATTVYLRDIPQVVTLGLTLLFYLTPVFYPLERVPDRYHWVLELNPLTTLIEAYRAVLLDQRMPEGGAVALVTLASAAFAVAALLLFRCLRPGFVDEL